ncbi:MAG: carbohydrate porin [Verrucomicrobiae bacterium]|nr:carbohydrate porin [Verrucomicrobiae bacterium]
MKTKPVFLILCLALCLPATAHETPEKTLRAGLTHVESQNPPHPATDWDATTLSGNWDGERDRLEAHGFTWTLNSTSDFQPNVVGGRRQVPAFFQRNTMTLTFDFDKTTPWKGASIYLSGVYQFGTLTSQNDIGNFMGVSSIAGFNGPMLNQYGLIQSFLDEKVELKLGKIAMQDEFALMDYHYFFVNNTFGNPQIIGGLAAPFTPNGQQGVRLRVELPEHLYFMTGAYNGKRNVFATDPNGINPSFNGDTVLGWEFGYQEADAAGSAISKMHYKAGAIYNFGDFNPYLGTTQVSGNHLIYAMMSQQVWRTSPDSEKFRGLAVAASVLTAPDQINQVEWMGELNLLYFGLFPDRPEDSTGIGFATAAFGNDFSRAQQTAGGLAATDETVLELNHMFVLSPGLRLQPSLQTIFQPAGAASRHDVLVLGLRGILDF